MKRFKKALAVLLSVLMVAFSFPLTSFALPNPDNADGRYSYDDDVVLHTYVVDYDGTDSWGYTSNYYYDVVVSGAVPTYDLKHLKKSDLKSEDGTFALVVTVENVDTAVFPSFGNMQKALQITMLSLQAMQAKKISLQLAKQPVDLVFLEHGATQTPILTLPM